MVSLSRHPSSPWSELDPKRIAGNTGVLLLHALAFALLMLPSRWQPPPVAEPMTVVPDFEVPRELPPPPPPPPPEQVPIRETPAPVTPPQVVEPALPPADPTPVFETGEIVAPPPTDAGPVVTTFEPGPQLETLAYAAHPPPRYPRTAIRGGHEGRVLLRVLVGPDGVPQEVTVEEGSGHRDLDRAARDQVLSAWRFHPAMRDGRAVAAWALVPIDFVLP